MTLGYQNDTVTITNTLNAVHQWLTTQQRAKLLHGEGESIVKFLQIVCNFSIKTKKWLDFRSASIYFYKIVDVILQNPTSILNREVCLCSLKVIILRSQGNLLKLLKRG